MLGYLFADTICSEMRTDLQEQGLRKTVNFKEPIMSKDKFEPSGSYFVYYPSNTFATCGNKCPGTAYCLL